MIKRLNKGVEDLNAVDGKGQNILMIAAANGHLDIVEFVLNHGGDVNAKDKNGKTAITLASQNGYLDIVECLFNAQNNGHLDFTTTENQISPSFLYAPLPNGRIRRRSG